MSATYYSSFPAASTTSLEAPSHLPSEKKFSADSTSTTSSFQSAGKLDSLLSYHSSDSEEEEDRWGTSPISHWRRTEAKDIPEIKMLMKEPQTGDLFGELDVAEIIELSYIALSQINAKGNLVAHISLYDYPNVPAMRAGQWMRWIRDLYCLNYPSTRSALFIRLMVWDTNYSTQFLPLLLHSVFINCPFLHEIILVVPPGAPIPEVCEEYFDTILPRGFQDINLVQTLHICMRQRLIRRLKIRKAVEEDNDDIVPIIHKLSKNLCLLYGEYYIAEMVRYPSKKKQMIVADENESAFGIMILSTDISYDMLNEQFELAPFYGLRNPDERDHFPDTSKMTSLDSLRIPVFVQVTDDMSDVTLKNTLLEGVSGGSNMEINQLDFDMDGSDSASSVEDDVILVESANASGLALNRYVPDEGSDDGTNSNVAVDEEEDLDVSKLIHNLSLNDNASGFTSKEMKEPTVVKTERSIPTYFGSANAFAIEVFAMKDDHDERTAFDFLEAAFETFPQMDYCIITLHQATRCFSLLDHFTRVIPRPGCSFPQELYALHRSSINCDTHVRKATFDDFADVEMLVSNSLRKANATNLLNEFKCAVSGLGMEELYCFLILSEETIVGVSILRQSDDQEYLRSHYEIEEFVNLEYHSSQSSMIIKHLTVSPIFSRHTRFFLKEIMRLNNMSILYHPLFYNDSIETGPMFDRSIATSISEMIPVKPRRQIQYCLAELEENIPSEQVLQNGDPFTLFLMTRRICSIAKMEINDRIVVVGASDTALAFLESLIFGEARTYITFNNLTLVSPHGLPGDKADYSIRDKWFLKSSRYSIQYTQRVNFRAYVNVVYGVMTSINRLNKYIVVDDDSITPYDHLMLFCGQQFQKPIKQKPCLDVFSLRNCMHDQRRSLDDDTNIPNNVFVMNTEIDERNALKLLQKFIGTQTSYTVIVYGHCVEAFSCIQVLIEKGFPASNITFVENFPKQRHAVSIFNNKELDQAVVDSMNLLGITHCQHHYFESWELEPVSNLIVSATFAAKTRMVTIPCIAMFCHSDKDVAPKTFKALSSAGLVYDGRLVISKNFETNDPNIYSAGPMTKYKRRYYADHLHHVYFNSVEIGTKVGEVMRRKFHNPNDEEGADLDEQDQEFSILTTDFVQPLVLSCTLPGGINYLKVSKPGKEMPLEAAMNKADFGTVLTTGQCSDVEPNYFRIHLGHNLAVETITCYTSNEIERDNFIRLHGRHEALLNNLVVRFNMGRIQDFYKYFQEPWAYALYSGDLDTLLQQGRLLSFGSGLGERGKTIVQRVINAYEGSKWKRLADPIQHKLKKQYNEAGYNKLLEKMVLDYIEKYIHLLPMYATRSKVKAILQGQSNYEIERSPIHHQQ